MQNRFQKKTLFAIPFYLALSLANNAIAGSNICGDSKYSTPFTNTTSDQHDQYSSNESTAPLNNVEYHEQVCQNIAISNALEDPDMVAGETKAVRINFAAAGSQNVTAFGISGAVVLSENALGNKERLTGSASIAFSGNQRGGRVGIQLSW